MRSSRDYEFERRGKKKKKKSPGDRKREIISEERERLHEAYRDIRELESIDPYDLSDDSLEDNMRLLFGSRWRSHLRSYQKLRDLHGEDYTAEVLSDSIQRKISSLEDEIYYLHSRNDRKLSKGDSDYSSHRRDLGNRSSVYEGYRSNRGRRSGSSRERESVLDILRRNLERDRRSSGTSRFGGRRHSEYPVDEFLRDVIRRRSDRGYYDYDDDDYSSGRDFEYDFDRYDRDDLDDEDFDSRGNREKSKLYSEGLPLFIISIIAILVIIYPNITGNIIGEKINLNHPSFDVIFILLILMNTLLIKISWNRFILHV